MINKDFKLKAKTYPFPYIVIDDFFEKEFYSKLELEFPNSKSFKTNSVNRMHGDTTFGDWTTTIINDEDFGVRKAIEQWMELLANKDLNTRSSFGGTKKEGKNADYKQDLIVDQYSKSGKIIQTYKFLGAFPTALSSIELGWENPVMQTYTCTWTYDCWEHGGSLSTDPRNLQFALDG